MKNNIQKSIKYLFLFALVGALFIIYFLPSMSEPTFEKVVGFYGEIYLSTLLGSFSAWWTLPNVSMIFKIVATVIGFLCLTTWVYMLKKNTYPFWKLAIPIAIWVLIGLFALFIGIISSI